MVADVVIIIVLLAMTPRSEMHAASYVFGSAGIVNQTGGWNSGLAFLFGLLSVQWTVRISNSLVPRGTVMSATNYPAHAQRGKCEPRW